MTDAAASVSPGIEPMETVRTRRVATVDVGTNSIRLLVAEVREDGGYRLLDDEKVVSRLGRGMSRSDALPRDAMEEAARTIAHMKAIAEGHRAELVRAVATCAVREAANREEFLDLVRERAGLEIEVVSGDDEARLAFLSVNAAFDLRHKDVAVVDLGGGSTEVVLSRGGMIEHIVSLPLGAVRLTEEAAASGGPPEQRLEIMRERVRAALKGRLRKRSAAPKLMIGTGGTFTTLAHIDRLKRLSEPTDGAHSSIRGYELKLADVRRHLDGLGGMTDRQRAGVAGLSPDRAEIIVAGITIIHAIMKRLGINVLQVHDRGIRDGLLLKLTGDLFPDAAVGAAAAPDRLSAVRRFAEKCRYERAHSEHVTDLALQILDQIVEQVPHLPESVRAPESRELLRTAGILHDIGYYINYAGHHKHSYHLIIHSDLPGFSHRELDLIAAVARYHRRSHPKRSHGHFNRLAACDQELVRYLSAILRVADGLDRAHASNVTRVRLDLERLTAWFTAFADAEPAVDLWGAARKSLLFARVFGVDARFVWNGDAAHGRAARDAAAQASSR